MEGTFESESADCEMVKSEVSDLDKVHINSADITCCMRVQNQ